MQLGAEHWWHIAGLVCLFMVAAFFSAAETALMSIDRLRVRYLADKERPGARQLQALLSHPERLLSAILLGNNLANIAASVFTTALFFELFGPRGELLIVLILTPLLVVFTEAWPKTYAARYPEKMCFLLLHPMRLIMWLLQPFTWALAGISSLLNRFLRGEEHRPLISEDELRSFIEFGEHAGVVAKDKRKMLHGVFDLGEIRVRDVMVPRNEVVGIEADTPFAEVLKVVAETHHSRFPVYEGDLDRVVGVIHTKEILDCLDSPEEFSLRRLARPPLFVPEAKPIEALLQTFRRRHLHLAMVVDEYGGVEGIVTLEDIFEVIVGEIQDEYDEEEALIRPLGPNRFMVDGSATLRAVNHRFALELSEEHVTTLAGFLMNALGRIPVEGDVCEAEGVRFTVRRMADRRIDEIEVELPTLPGESSATR
ncbi:MAG: HlyC/CorC family transporter [Desulfuromonas sp.]|nr:HlyC/CorC family transporter [Desulfuromonas sp.]